MHDHSHWPGTLTAVAVSGLWATLADMPWATVFSLVGIALSAIGPAAVRTWRDWRLARIEIAAREAKARG